MGDNQDYWRRRHCKIQMIILAEDFEFCMFNLRKGGISDGNLCFFSKKKSTKNEENQKIPIIIKGVKAWAGK